MKKSIFEDQIKSEFLKGFAKNQRPITKEKTTEAYFYIFSSKEKQYYKYLFQLYDNLIFCKKDNDSAEIAYMDIGNSFLKQSEPVMINKELNYGVKFIKKRAYEELYSSDKKVVDEWFEILKKNCILTKFRLYFDTVKVLGKGNFAKVYLVERKADKKQFAVKVFDKNVIMPNEDEVKCLLYELKMMRTTNFYRVLTLIELYEGEDHVYALCELYNGQNLLNSIIKKGSQPEAKALTIILQLLEALNYLHSKKIMHRDIKPENIVFRTSQESIDIGVVDLGFATYEEDYRKLFVRCGTPGYVAPEILNDKDYDCKVDVFSAGVVFFMMCFNQSYRISSFQRQFV